MTERANRKAIVPRQKLFGNPRQSNGRKHAAHPQANRVYKPWEWQRLTYGDPLREQLRAEYERALQPPDPWGGEAA